VFWNMTAHLFTSLSFLVEMSLTTLPVYLLHIPYMLSWAAVFCAFTWIIVAVHIRFWPYSFMPAGHITCLFWYSGLILGSMMFYYLWRSLSVLKFNLTCGGAESNGEDSSFRHSNEHDRDKSQTDLSGRSTFMTVSQSISGSMQKYNVVSNDMNANSSLSDI
jgi:hypothetical protein